MLGATGPGAPRRDAALAVLQTKMSTLNLSQAALPPSQRCPWPPQYHQTRRDIAAKGNSVSGCSSTPGCVTCKDTYDSVLTSLSPPPGLGGGLCTHHSLRGKLHPGRNVCPEFVHLLGESKGHHSACSVPSSQTEQEGASPLLGKKVRERPREPHTPPPESRHPSLFGNTRSRRRASAFLPGSGHRVQLEVWGNNLIPDLPPDRMPSRSS